MVISVFKPNFCDLIKTNTITLKEKVFPRQSCLNFRNIPYYSKFSIWRGGQSVSQSESHKKDILLKSAICTRKKMEKL